MKIALGIIVALIIVWGAPLFVKNQKPQIKLGLNNGKFDEIPNKKNAVSTETIYEDKLVNPLQLKKTLDESKEAMKMAFDSYGGIEIKKEESNYIKFWPNLFLIFGSPKLTKRSIRASQYGGYWFFPW